MRRFVLRLNNALTFKLNEMESKTILDLFKEKVFNCKDIGLLNITDNRLSINRLEDVCLQVCDGAPFLLTTTGREMLKLFGTRDDIDEIKAWLHKDVSITSF